MPTENTSLRPTVVLLAVPDIIADAGDGAARRFLEFFTVKIENPNTRAAFALSVAGFLRWYEQRRLGLRDIEPIAIAAHFSDAHRLRPHQEAAPGRCADAVRLAGDGPHRALQPGQLGPGAQARGEEGQNAGAFRRGRPGRSKS
jgi:hypothetical protein